MSFQGKGSQKLNLVDKSFSDRSYNTNCHASIKVKYICPKYRAILVFQLHYASILAILRKYFLPILLQYFLQIFAHYCFVIKTILRHTFCSEFTLLIGSGSSEKQLKPYGVKNIFPI